MTYIILYVLLGVILLFLVVMAFQVPRGRKQKYISLIKWTAIAIGFIVVQQLIESFLRNVLSLFE